jgi:hypothetical protein
MGADTRGNQDPPLVVEIREDDEESLVFFSQDVLHRDLHIVKGDVGGSGGRRIARLDRLCLYPWLPLDEEDGKPFLRNC